MSDHSIRVVTLLTPEEYVAMQAMADGDGLSDSAYIRRLIRLAAQAKALESVSATKAERSTAEPAQVVRSRFHAE